MAKQKTIEQLKAEKEKVEQQIEQEQHKLRRLLNREQYYEKGERTKRAHRLITRGAAVESIAPEVKEMTEQGFYSLMANVLNKPDIKEHIETAVKRQEGSE